MSNEDNQVKAMEKGNVRSLKVIPFLIQIKINSRNQQSSTAVLSTVVIKFELTFIIEVQIK